MLLEPVAAHSIDRYLQKVSSTDELHSQGSAVIRRKKNA